MSAGPARRAGRIRCRRERAPRSGVLLLAGCLTPARGSDSSFARTFSVSFVPRSPHAPASRQPRASGCWTRVSAKSAWRRVSVQHFGLPGSDETPSRCPSRIPARLAALPLRLPCGGTRSFSVGLASIAATAAGVNVRGAVRGGCGRLFTAHFVLAQGRAVACPTPKSRALRAATAAAPAQVGAGRGNPPPDPTLDAGSQDRH